MTYGLESIYFSKGFNILLHTISGWTPDHNMMDMRGVIRHPYCRVFKLKKSKNRKIWIFEKPDFPVRIRIRWYGNIRGVTLRSQEVRRSEKKRKNNFRKIRISRIRIRISGSPSMPLRRGPKGLPVAKISDL